MLTQKQLDRALKELERIKEIYKEKYKEEGKKKDWRTYEERIARRIKKAAEELEPIANEALGRPQKLPVPQKVIHNLICLTPHSGNCDICILRMQRC